MNKSTPVTFTAPEMEAALQLIQLRGGSGAHLPCDEVSDSAGDVLATANMKRRKEICDDGESERSSASDMTSSMRFGTPSFFDAGVVGSRRKRKKFRSVFEIYEISNF
ncbi:hypothetical protein L1987_55046 [Smallanthus sonchifolius]|uniref:Uncharacterized protein n=1 Tax=Smallanthus sonchifolius TaxID=185202 RepID=A0ACB9E8R0_9ASTR|nr:hypothetical protein L1987_55046 [Smallanthus sonchifolius]